MLPFLQLVTWLQAEDSQNYYPKLLLSDYESEIQAMLGLAESKYEKELQDTVGPTAFRLGKCREPDRLHRPFGQTCSDQYHKQDPNYTHNLEGVGVAMTWCQNIYLFAQAATMAGNNLTRDTFNNAMSQIQGLRWQRRARPHVRAGRPRRAAQLPHRADPRERRPQQCPT